MINRNNGAPNLPASAEVIQHMMAAVNNATPPALSVTPPGDTPASSTISGNLGDYKFGLKEDGKTENNTQAVWELSSANVTKAKTKGAKLVLVLSTAPTATLQFAWQNPETNSWWNQTDSDILGKTGRVVSTRNAAWNADTKTLTINMSAAKNYSAFTSAASLNLILQYFGGRNVNDLGIVSANLE